MFTFAEWLCRAYERLDPPECRDHVVVFGAAPASTCAVVLHGILNYNPARTHLSLGKDTPIRRAVQSDRTHPNTTCSWPPIQPESYLRQAQDACSSLQHEVAGGKDVPAADLDLNLQARPPQWSHSIRAPCSRRAHGTIVIVGAWLPFVLMALYFVLGLCAGLSQSP
jgi:hypothetical protein